MEIHVWTFFYVSVCEGHEGSGMSDPSGYWQAKSNMSESIHLFPNQNFYSFPVLLYLWWVVGLLEEERENF